MEISPELSNKEFLHIGLPVVFTCFKGLERSPAIVRLLKDAGFDAEYFPGGTKSIAQLSEREISKKLSDKFVFIIYDPGSDAQEHRARMITENKFDDNGILYEVISTSVLATIGYNHNKNLDDYLI